MTALTLFAIYVSGAVIAGVIALKVSGPENRWINLAHWIIGVTLTLTVLMLTTLIAFTAQCATRDTTGGLDLNGCGDGLKSWFTVLQSWQGGIGAAVGLLGLGWSTHFNASRKK